MPVKLIKFWPAINAHDWKALLFYDFDFGAQFLYNAIKYILQYVIYLH